MKKSVILALSLLAVAVAGCKKDENKQESLSFVLTGDIADVEQVQQSSSKTVASKSSFAADDQIGVFVVPYKNTTTAGVFYGSGNYADNVPFTTTDGSKFTSSAAISFPNETTPVDIYAFGMYHTQYNTLGDDVSSSPQALPWTVDAVQNSAATIVKNDVMSAAAKNITPQSNAIPLVFRHRLAKVEISFTLPTTFRGYAVSGATLNVQGTKPSTIINMTDPTIAPSVASGVVTPIAAYRALPITEAANVLGYTFEAIVVPQTVSAGSVIASVVLDVQTIGKQTLDCQSGLDIVYTAGNNTQLTLSFSSEETLSLGTVSITPWNPINGGSVAARRPAKMIFSTSGTSIDIDLIKYAELTIDGKKYTASVVRNTTTKNLECTYLQEPALFGEKLSKALFLKADGTTPINPIAFNPAFGTSTPINIPGDPLSYKYDKIVSQAQFN